MTSKQIRDLAPAELDSQYHEASDKLLQLRLRKQTGQVEKTHEIRAIRKDVARLQTARTAQKAKKA